ncbi:4-hydroxy-tetrahydrodipicolinate reductase [Acidipila sp. EB88]|uniref:4-hydroxy-tetrahydrodipicolinate reductase n=1 Tax=Acidipila sp. EB88 TaxID=2305226 RepID=UPI000F5FB955|nr:4-hydroxy-tetrahydrodipicolinate reductase [Acidipila sp. EB88]RRA48806.1 4-hydroxy-tetrahydrodipicolinate reductase [Acidipila sp. EB88]
MSNFLVLGRGKTGSAVAQVVRQRGHDLQVVTSEDNHGGRALTPGFLASIDVVVDFTTPEAVVDNLRMLLPQGAKVVVGTTGWYAALPELAALAEAHGASLLHGTNYSLGVQAFFRAAKQLAAALPGYALEIEETHHVTKKDVPSGTALTLQRIVQQAAGLAREQTAWQFAPESEAPITSHREADAAGLHVLTLSSPEEVLTLRHEAFSRMGFANGAVRAAEWLVAREAPGVWDFADVATELS